MQEQKKQLVKTPVPRNQVIFFQASISQGLLVLHLLASIQVGEAKLFAQNVKLRNIISVGPTHNIKYQVMYKSYR